MANCFIVFLIVLAASPPQEGAAIPQSLVRAHENRMRFKTAAFTYDYEFEWPGRNATQRHRFEARLSGDDTYWINQGDDDGIRMLHGVTGERMIGVRFACAPKHIIRNRKTDEQWSIHDGDNSLILHRASIKGPFREVSDPRSFGLASFEVRDHSPTDLLDRFSKDDAVRHWKTRKVGTMEEIVLSYRSPEGGNAFRGEVIWRIDPLRDYAVVEISNFIFDEDDKRTLVRHATTQYGEFDGRWWPTRFESIAPETGVRELAVFHRVEFDRPEHPRVLNPDIWGLPAGVKVTSHWNAPETGDLETGHYIGGGVFITREEWGAVKHQYDQDALRQFWNRNAEIGTGNYPKWWASLDGSYGLSDVERTPDHWEAYVRRWIFRHTNTSVIKRVEEPLTEEQITAARAILKDCRRRAEPVVRRMQEKEKTRSLKAPTGSATHALPAAHEANAENAAQAKPPGESPTLRAKTENSDRNERELEEIFHLLKTRLTGLLREKQMLPDDKFKLPPVAEESKR